MDLEEVWEEREESVYPKIFGTAAPGIYNLSRELFLRGFGAEPDMVWLHYGVMEFAPTATRPYWAFVSSGLSNPETDGNGDVTTTVSGLSGSGYEIMVCAKEKFPWAVTLTQLLMAQELLYSVGFYDDIDILDHGAVRTVKGFAANDMPSELGAVVIVENPDLPKEFLLPSGSVQLFNATGVSLREVDFCKKEGLDALFDLLKKNNAFIVTDPARKSFV